MEKLAFGPVFKKIKGIIQMHKFHFTLFCTGQGLVMAEMSHAVMSIDLKEGKRY